MQRISQHYSRRIIPCHSDIVALLSPWWSSEPAHVTGVQVTPGVVEKNGLLSAVVRWNRLSLKDWGGLPKIYTVTYTPVADACGDLDRQRTEPIKISPANTSAEITDLLLLTTYEVEVRAEAIVAGIGNGSRIVMFNTSAPESKFNVCGARASLSVASQQSLAVFMIDYPIDTDIVSLTQ